MAWLASISPRAGQHVGDVGQEAVVGPDHQHPGPGRAGRGTRTAGRRRGAARRPSCRCRGRPGCTATGPGRRGRWRPARAGWWRRCRASARSAGARSPTPRCRRRLRPRRRTRSSSSYAVIRPWEKPNRRRRRTPIGCAGLGLVERPGHAGPPVDHHRLAAGLAGHVPAADVERLVLLGAQVGRVVQPAEEQRHVGGVLQRLHPPIEGLLQMLGGDVVAADRGQPGGVLTHPPQGRPGLGQVVLFAAQDVGRQGLRARRRLRC